MATTRVYILARELGVKSSSIVKKCQDEGLDVRNHMATISAGLAATIREWFSEGENVTTVETAEKVDLDEVRVRKKPRHMEGTAASDGEETEVSVLEPEEILTEAVTVEEPEPVVMEEPQQEVLESTPAEVVQVEPEPVAPTAPPVPAVAAQVQEATVPKVEEKPVREPPKPVAKPKEPMIVLPAGPMLDKPRPAKLSGPQVVRVEAPEPMDRPAVQVQASLRCPGYRAPDLQEQRRRHGRQAGGIRGRRQEGREGPHHQGSDPRPSQGRGG